MRIASQCRSVSWVSPVWVNMSTAGVGKYYGYSSGISVPWVQLV